MGARSDSLYCKHGVFVGGLGADRMCGYCESGTEPEPHYVVVDGDGEIVLPGPFTLAQAESLVKAYWASGREAYTA